MRRFASLIAVGAMVGCDGNDAAARMPLCEGSAYDDTFIYEPYPVWLTPPPGPSGAWVFRADSTTVEDDVEVYEERWLHLTDGLAHLVVEEVRAEATRRVHDVVERTGPWVETLEHEIVVAIPGTTAPPDLTAPPVVYRCLRTGLEMDCRVDGEDGEDLAFTKVSPTRGAVQHWVHERWDDGGLEAETDTDGVTSIVERQFLLFDDGTAELWAFPSRRGGAEEATWKIGEREVLAYRWRHDAYGRLWLESLDGANLDVCCSDRRCREMEA